MPDLEPPRCPICADAGWLRGPGPLGTLVRCVCNAGALAPPATTPPPNVVVLRRRGAGRPS